jgi:hypothetical protein
LLLRRLLLESSEVLGTFIYNLLEEYGEKNTYAYVCVYIYVYLECISEGLMGLRSASEGLTGYSSAGPT